MTGVESSWSVSQTDDYAVDDVEVIYISLLFYYNSIGVIIVPNDCYYTTISGSLCRHIRVITLPYHGH